ncbi:hypothetical protein Pint_22444 [Pistacia integerrima]|uniref:Uncharacterized protein n=1 Tax=Pistacia integerrima TaxID=434235 RepID=A0ACC0YIP6_9ROSI|nr:hypothetical protein Pint_22444 [Pistacia integerrima]
MLQRFQHSLCVSPPRNTILCSWSSRLFPQTVVYRIFSPCSARLSCASIGCRLSKGPEELLDRSSGAWNKGKIHYAFARKEVLNAYANQFARDLESFLNARAKEIVPGGIIVISNPSIPDEMPFSNIAKWFDV